MKTSSPTYVWANELVAQIIEGACDGFLIVAGGSTAGQLTGAAVAVTPKQLLTSVVIGAAIYGASYLKKHPLPTVTIQPSPVITPTIPNSQ